MFESKSYFDLVLRDIKNLVSTGSEVEYIKWFASADIAIYSTVDEHLTGFSYNSSSAISKSLQLQICFTATFTVGKIRRFASFSSSLEVHVRAFSPIYPPLAFQACPNPFQ